MESTCQLKFASSISQIAVHNVGQGKLTLMDHNEEYICTFPSAYGRSILTVPWVELGGKVSITCPQTNYHANIEFKCKQFFSSDVNKVSWDQPRFVHLDPSLHLEFGCNSDVDMETDDRFHVEY